MTARGPVPSGALVTTAYDGQRFITQWDPTRRKSWAASDAQADRHRTEIRRHLAAHGLARLPYLPTKKEAA